LVWPLLMLLTCALASCRETGHLSFVSTHVANSWGRRRDHHAGRRGIGCADLRIGQLCLIALVATGRPLRPVRRVVRIGLVATDGSRYLQSGTICPAICYRYLFGVAN
jgi:hypothetical protein